MRTARNLEDEAARAMTRAERLAMRDPRFRDAMATAYASLRYRRRARSAFVAAGVTAAFLLGALGRSSCSPVDLAEDPVDSPRWQRAVAVRAADLPYRSAEADAAAAEILPRLAAALPRTLKLSIPLIGRATPRSDRVAFLRAMLHHVDDGVRREAAVWYRVVVPDWSSDATAADAITRALNGG